MRDGAHKMIPEITITDHLTCGDVLLLGSCWDVEEEVNISGPFDNVISIVGTWEDMSDPPGGWDTWRRYPARKLRLEFDDVQYESFHGDPPAPSHIQKIIEFSRGLKGRTIIHCGAGISRSTAAAFIVLLSVLGDGQETEALRVLRTLRKVMRPHRNMVKMADELLNRGGRVVELYESIWGVEAPRDSGTDFEWGEE